MFARVAELFHLCSGRGHLLDPLRDMSFVGPVGGRDDSFQNMTLPQAKVHYVRHRRQDHLVCFFLGRGTDILSFRVSGRILTELRSIIALGVEVREIAT